MAAPRNRFSHPPWFDGLKISALMMLLIVLLLALPFVPFILLQARRAQMIPEPLGTMPKAHLRHVPSCRPLLDGLRRRAEGHAVFRLCNCRLAH